MSKEIIHVDLLARETEDKEKKTRHQSRLSSPYYKRLGRPADKDSAKMVAEGAMTSVMYYNRLMEEESEQE